MNPISDPLLKNLSINLFKTSKAELLINGDNIQFPLLNNFSLINNFELPKSIIDENSSLFKSINNQEEFQKGISSSINSDRRQSDIVIEKEIEPKNRIFIENDDKYFEINQYFEKKYRLKYSPDNIIKIPINYSTDDYDEFQITSIINEPLENDWKLAIEDYEYNIKVYKKEVLYTQALLLKTFGEIPFSLNVIFNVLEDYNFRKNWDEDCKNIIVDKLPKSNNEYESYIQYVIMKFPTFMEDRDFVQKFKIWKNYLGDNKRILKHNKSVNYYKYPEKINLIRGEMIIGGYFLEEINSNLTKCIFINNSDLKISSGISLINKREIENQQNHIKYLVKGCEMWVKEKYN